MITYEVLKKKLSMSKLSYNLDKIKVAYEYAFAMHDGQFRKSGEPYICHPLSVAEIVADLSLDTESICAALLHDTIEDCKDKTNYDVIKKMVYPSIEKTKEKETKVE